MPHTIRHLITGLLLCLAGLTQAANDPGRVFSLETRPGVRQPFILIEPENAVATVMLFPGYGGYIDVQEGPDGPTVRSENFLVRSRQLFAEQGLRVVVVDAPSDKHYVEGMLYGFRNSGKHVTDIAALIDWLKARADQPIWLVGTSRGTESAAHLAIALPDRVDGLILTSPMSVPNDKGRSVPMMALEKIRQPVQIVVHLEDACHVTPSYGAEKIRKGLTGARTVEIAEFTGGRKTHSDSCGPMGPHGFLGIESEVVDRIADFIRSH